MTLGEKIQNYRKRDGLSQEELARLLLISRQTVSLWETGQTYPTIDNLIRLREIFGVSIDEMLVDEEPIPDAPPQIPEEPPIPQAPAERKAPRALRTVSTVLFVLSIVSGVWTLLFGLALLQMIALPYISLSVISVLFFLCFIQMPIASLIFGFCIRARRYCDLSGKQNIIVGIVMIGVPILLSVILLVGSMTMRVVSVFPA